MSYSVFSSDGTSLEFPTKELYAEYKEEEKKLVLKFYCKIRALYGIWASNQNKFVATVEELDDWDSKEMENRYSSSFSVK